MIFHESPVSRPIFSSTSSVLLTRSSYRTSLFVLCIVYSSFCGTLLVQGNVINRTDASVNIAGEIHASSLVSTKDEIAAIQRSFQRDESTKLTLSGSECRYRSDCPLFTAHMECRFGRCECEIGYIRTVWFNELQCQKSFLMKSCTFNFECESEDIGMFCNEQGKCECRSGDGLRYFSTTKCKSSSDSLLNFHTLILTTASNPTMLTETPTFTNSSGGSGLPNPLAVFAIIFAVTLSVFIILWAIKKALTKWGPSPNSMQRTTLARLDSGYANIQNASTVHPPPPSAIYSHFTTPPSNTTNAQSPILAAYDKPPDYNALEDIMAPPPYEAVATNRTS